MNLRKHEQDVYAESYKTLIKEIKKDQNYKQRNILCSRYGRFNTVKMLILPKLINKDYL